MADQEDGQMLEWLRHFSPERPAVGVLHPKAPFPPPELVRRAALIEDPAAWWAVICSGDLALPVRVILGDVVPPPTHPAPAP